MPLMYASRAEDSDETPAIGSPPGCLSALDPYPDLVCQSHRTLSIKPCATAAVVWHLPYLHLLL